jgi:lipoate-protein ligase B
VGYPLLPLGQVNSENKLPQADYVGYVRKLEKTLIIALANLGLVAGQRSGLTGVWIQSDVHSRCPRCSPADRKKPAKIAAIGVKVDARGVSRHGFALNVNPDMEYWDGIIACGLQDEPIVSLADLFPEPPTMEHVVKEEVVKAFREVFGM